MKNLILIGRTVITMLIVNTITVGAYAQLKQDGPTISRPKDGTYYEVQFTKYVFHPCACCGFNDLGFANSGKFEVEMRRYYILKNSEEVKVWYKEVEIRWTGECIE